MERATYVRKNFGQRTPLALPLGAIQATSMDAILRDPESRASDGDRSAGLRQNATLAIAGELLLLLQFLQNERLRSTSAHSVPTLSRTPPSASLSPAPSKRRGHRLRPDSRTLPASGTAFWRVFARKRLRRPKALSRVRRVRAWSPASFRSPSIAPHCGDSLPAPSPPGRGSPSRRAATHLRSSMRRRLAPFRHCFRADSRNAFGNPAGTLWK